MSSKKFDRKRSDKPTEATPSRRTPAERDAAFDRYVERSASYFDAVEANGNTPWHEGDVRARRELFDRRYTRPAPPAMIPPIRSLQEMNRRAQDIPWSNAPATPTLSKPDAVHTSVDLDEDDTETPVERVNRLREVFSARRSA